jgi:hypothetical protein
VYDHLHTDPRFFLLGASSSYSSEMIAPGLLNLRERASTSSSRETTFFPPGLDHLHKVETAILPDGTMYKLQSIWYKTAVTTVNAATQTEEVQHRRKVDAQTQSSARLQLID